MDENTEVGTPTIENPSAIEAEDTALPNVDNVKEAIQKARQQEKAKLYPQVEKLQEEIAALRSKEQQRAAEEAERVEKRKQREAERQAEKKQQIEDEMSFKELLQTKEKEFQEKLVVFVKI